MSDLREKLLVAATEASINKVGIDINSSAIHADAIVKLVNAIVEKAEKK
jgi:hypothetical protein